MSAHGTRTRYVAGCRCDECREANRIYVADRRRRRGGAAAEYASRKARGLAADDPRHGTRLGYNGWGCRCQPCRAANAEYQRARRKQVEP